MRGRPGPAGQVIPSARLLSVLMGVLWGPSTPREGHPTRCLGQSTCPRADTTPGPSIRFFPFWLAISTVRESTWTRPGPRAQSDWPELRCGGHGRRERGWRGAVSTAISDPRSKPARLWPERASSSASGWRKCPTRAGALTSSSARAEGAAWARTQGAPAPAPPPRAQDVRLMTGCCWAPPTSWPGECDRIHLITGTFGCRVIWCPQVSCSISTGHGTTPGYFSPKAPNAGSPTRGPSSGAGSPAVRSRP